MCFGVRRADVSYTTGYSTAVCACTNYNTYIEKAIKVTKNTDFPT